MPRIPERRLSPSIRYFGTLPPIIDIDVSTRRQDLIPRFLGGRVEVPQQDDERVSRRVRGVLRLGVEPLEDQFGTLRPGLVPSIVPVGVCDDDLFPTSRAALEVDETGDRDHARLTCVPPFRTGPIRVRRKPAMLDRLEREPRLAVKDRNRLPRLLAIVATCRDCRVRRASKGSTRARAPKNRKKTGESFPPSELTHSDVAKLFAHEVFEISQLVVQHLLEPDAVELVEQDLIDQLFASACPRRLSFGIGGRLVAASQSWHGLR